MIKNLSNSLKIFKIFKKHQNFGYFLQKNRKKGAFFEIFDIFYFLVLFLNHCCFYKLFIKFYVFLFL